MTDTTPEPTEGSIPETESLISTGSPESRSSADRWKIAGLIAGAAALVAAVVFAGFVLFGGNTEQSAAEDLFAALENEDLLGVSEVLLPGERDIFFEPLLEVFDELERLGISSQVDLDGLQGLDLQFADLLFEVEEVGDGLAWVTVTGKVTLTVEGQELPIGPLVERYLPDDWADEIPREGETTDLDGFGIAVVSQGRHWYISLAHTIGELARRDAGLPFPAEAAIAEPSGAASPEEALEEMVQGVVNLDIHRLMDVLDPDDTAALRRYSGLFMDDWDSSMAEIQTGLADASVVYSLDVVASSETTEGITVAWIESIPRFDLAMDVPDLGAIGVNLADDCLKILMPPEAAEELLVLMPDLELDPATFDGITCVDVEALGGTLSGADQAAIDPEILYGMPVFGPVYERWMSAFEARDEGDPFDVEFQAIEHGGRWFISPIRSVHRWWMAGMQTLDEVILTELGDGLEYAAQNPEAFEQEMLEYFE
ncbi:MAG: hypothetical protein MUP76_00640 [Acidimicrobiia bacterium]|nr:hypothetical protein [Acidimicrobiia bacterium]